MSGYDLEIKILAAYHGEAKHFLNFLRRVGSKYSRPSKINYRYRGRGKFYLTIDGSVSGLDSLFQELLINKGLYYYCCTLSRSTDIIRHVVLPIYRQLIETRFDNTQSRFLRKHLLGKFSQNDFIPTNLRGVHGYEYEVLFRKWDLDNITNRDFVISLDALLTRLLLERSDHDVGERSPQFRTLLNKVGRDLVVTRETRKTFEKIHSMSRGVLHRLSNVSAVRKLGQLASSLFWYFEYLDEFDESQEYRTAILQGKRYRRIRYGKERTFPWFGVDDSDDPVADWLDFTALKGCGDCAVSQGQLHVDGCDCEECPRCGHQFMGCDENNCCGPPVAGG